MTPGEGRFVEEMGSYLGSLGMTPMAGRMWGWLLISDEEEQTAAQMAEALHASRGAISGTARILAGAGLVRRSTRRGDRREYFSAPPEALESLLKSGGRIYTNLLQITERGLDSISERPPEARARLEEMRDVLSFIASEIPTLVERFLRERASRMQTVHALPPPAQGDRRDAVSAPEGGPA